MKYKKFKNLPEVMTFLDKAIEERRRTYFFWLLGKYHQSEPVEMFVDAYLDNSKEKVNKVKVFDSHLKGLFRDNYEHDLSELANIVFTSLLPRSNSRFLSLTHAAKAKNAIKEIKNSVRKIENHRIKIEGLLHEYCHEGYDQFQDYFSLLVTLKEVSVVDLVQNSNKPSHFHTVRFLEQLEADIEFVEKKNKTRKKKGESNESLNLTNEKEFAHNLYAFFYKRLIDVKRWRELPFDYLEEGVGSALDESTQGLAIRFTLNVCAIFKNIKSPETLSKLVYEISQRRQPGKNTRLGKKRVADQKPLPAIDYDRFEGKSVHLIEKNTIAEKTRFYNQSIEDCKKAQAVINSFKTKKKLSPEEKESLSGWKNHLGQSLWEVSAWEKSKNIQIKYEALLKKEKPNRYEDFKKLVDDYRREFESLHKGDQYYSSGLSPEEMY